MSIGYSSCDWCHVMAHDLFQHQATARFRNGNSVNIEADREERPDLDAISMRAVMAVASKGGWPLTIFLTTEGNRFAQV